MHSFSKQGVTIGGAVCGCLVLITAALAISFAAIHGLPNTSGLDGERNHIEMMGEGGGASIAHTSCIDDNELDPEPPLLLHNTSGHGHNSCAAVVRGELFTTLSLWLFVWGVSTVTALVMTAFVTWCLGIKTWPGVLLEVIAGIITFFAFVPWGIIGLIILSRRRYNVVASDPEVSGNLWTDDAVYITSIAAMVIIFFVWLVGFGLVTANTGEADRGIAILWEAAKASESDKGVSKANRRELDLLSDAVLPTGEKKSLA